MNEQSQPQPMPQTKPAMVRPWLLIVFIIVALAGAGYFGWRWYSNHKTTTPSPSNTTTTISTADWKTYINETYKFSFKYPKGLLLEIQNPNDALTPGQNKTTNTGLLLLLKDSASQDQIYTLDIENNAYKDIAEWANNMNTASPGGLQVHYDIKDTLVAQIPAKELFTAGEGGAYRTGFIKGDNLYNFDLLEVNNYIVYKTILSTFQFSP